MWSALAAADARVLRRLRWRRQVLEDGPLVRFAAHSGLDVGCRCLSRRAAAERPCAWPLPAQRAQAQAVARSFSGESAAAVSDSAPTSSATGNSEGPSPHARHTAGVLRRADARGAQARVRLAQQRLLAVDSRCAPRVSASSRRSASAAPCAAPEIVPPRVQTSEAAASERLIERQILRERLALEGAASTYRKIGAQIERPRCAAADGLRFCSWPSRCAR